ncbi:MAG TPA: DoxX family protein [Bryobacteraceae bacterium]
MFEQANSGEPRNVLGDWACRGFVGLAAIFVGWDKFAANTQWPLFFQRLGLGEWFRYFTGIVEILGGVLALIPRTAAAGLALLAVTMAGAAVADAVVQPNAAAIPAVFAVILGTYAWTRWKQ